VIYPDIEEPYRSIFTKIVEGIEDRMKVRIASYAVGPNSNTQSLVGDLRKQDIRVVIALGRQGLKTASALDKGVAVVAGGIFSAPEIEARTTMVHSLAPDPGLLFSRLKNLVPSVRRIFVVYDPRTNAWLMRLARDAAAQQGIELNTLEARDLKTAVKHYQDILALADSKKDAIWLPQDATTVEEATILPLILKESWDRSLPVFSSNVSHVRRGVLFSLYPDNIELGRILATSALGLLASNSTGSRSILPLKEVQTAINLRTANHLGINLSYRQQKGFDLIFPEP
jgi:putative ABC transport system substrate-binding protein